ncbi:unnamed protein product [Brachionus calyciflorus]|uniref:Uncharacterized protein n=1 Tax=Brachionus calyciflorus TaxID=104777 RepID=A0A814DJL2_9BILA|nr:unnamed protein product [Brachionus calyciflorus]
MSENQKISCACKGIRKCVLCAPELIHNEIKDEKQLFQNSKNVYIYCPKCNLCILLNNFLIDEINDFLNQKISSISCTCNATSNNNILKVNGIYVKNNFINEKEETFLLKEIEKNKWVESQSGRYKQDYGPKANFNKKKLKYSTFTGLPEYSKFLIDRLGEIETLNNFIPVELCNLKYESNRGACIDPHFDDFWLWGERLITFNLVENTILTLTPGKDVQNTPENCQVLIPSSRLSMIILADDARYKWLHAIKKSHIKSTRLAITIRELTDEFKLDEKQGKLIEKLAMTYKGITVGEIEEYFRNNLVEFKTEEMVYFCVERFKEKMQELDYFKIDFNDKYENFVIDSVYFNIGEILAKWILDSKKIFYSNLDEEIERSIQIKSVKNFILIHTNFEVYLQLLRSFFNESKLDLNLKSKLIACVYKIHELTKENSNNMNNISEMVYDGFELEFVRTDPTSKKTKIMLYFQKNMFISLRHNNLAYFLTKFIILNSMTNEQILTKIKSTVNGYSSITKLLSNDLKLLSLLIFLNLSLESINNKFDWNLIEYFYFINLE